MDGYRDLAQAVVLQAAQDLLAIYKVTADLQKREKAGTLTEYVDKLMRKKRKGYVVSMLMPRDMLTAIDFFKKGHAIKDITYGMIGREGNSKTISAMRDYCLENTLRLRRKVAKLEKDILNKALS